jgi:dipeptidase D
VVTTQRSLLELEKALICEKIETIFTMGQANVVHTNNYPGWSPNVDSNILKIAKFSYKRLFGEEPIVTSIHAGLECGILKNKNTALDMISLGPTITGVHSPSETLDIKSVEKIWTLLVAILREMK